MKHTKPTFKLHGINYFMIPAPPGFRPDTVIDGVPHIRSGVHSTDHDPACRSEQPSAQPPDPGTTEPYALPQPAPAELVEARLAVCVTCTSWVHRCCSVAGCRCNGSGQAAHLSSRCPQQKWTA